MRIDVYSRWDAYQGTIGADELLSLVHTDELNGSDELAIQTTHALHEGERLVWKDRLGKVHEHVCQDPKGTHDGSITVYSDTALNSVCELFGDYIEDRRPYSYSYLRALNVALEPTRWEAGTVDQEGTVASGLTFYHTSSREALQAILECGGEMETTIETDGTAVTARKVGIRQHRGESSTHRRFSYGKDITGISRTEVYGAITACYGYGKGMETDTGGYGRKLTFGDINDGKNYVVDKAALEAYGRPDGKGGKAHVFGEYENSDCEDASQLLSETKDYLASHCEPGVTYTAEVVDLVQFARDWEGVGVGDDVQIVDSAFSPELRCEGRVTKLVTDLLGGTMEVTLGNIADSLADVFSAQQQAVSSLSKRSSNWDVAANTPATYLQQVIDGLNEQFNAKSSCYCFTSFEQGTIWSSVPLDDQGQPTKAGGSAIQICSQGFRIASGTKADGSYDWRTFGTGEGFTADEITAGTLNADLIKTGTILCKNDDDEVVCSLSISNSSGLSVRNPYSGRLQPLSWSAFTPIYHIFPKEGKVSWAEKLGSSTKETTARKTFEFTVDSAAGWKIIGGEYLNGIRFEIYDYFTRTWTKTAGLSGSNIPIEFGEILTVNLKHYNADGSFRKSSSFQISGPGDATNAPLGIYYHPGYNSGYTEVDGITVEVWATCRLVSDARYTFECSIGQPQIYAQAY